MASLEWQNAGQPLSTPGITGHRMIGGALLRQIRVTQGCHDVPSSFAGTVTACTPVELDQVKSEYQGVQWQEDIDGELWSPVTDVAYPGDGYAYVLTGNATETEALGTTLEVSNFQTFS